MCGCGWWTDFCWSCFSSLWFLAPSSSCYLPLWFVFCCLFFSLLFSASHVLPSFSWLLSFSSPLLFLWTVCFLNRSEEERRHKHIMWGFFVMSLCDDVSVMMLWSVLMRKIEFLIVVRKLNKYSCEKTLNMCLIRSLADLIPLIVAPLLETNMETFKSCKGGIFEKCLWKCRWSSV